MPKKHQVFRKSDSYQELDYDYELVDTLYQGTTAMRAQGDKYLPIADGEDRHTKYPKRLNKTVLFNKYKDTIEQSVGKSVTNEATVTNATTSFTVDNVNGEGADLSTYIKHTLQDTIQYGIDFIVIDYPVLTPNATLADEVELGATPYFASIKAPNVLETRCVFKGSKKLLSYFRFIETDSIEVNVDGWIEEHTIQQVKVFKYNEEGQIIYEIWRENDGEAYLYDSNVIIGPSVLPVVPVYGNKVDFYKGRPVLLDLAHLNLAHWQDYSDLRFNQNLTLNPIMKTWGLAGATDEHGEPIEIKASPDTRLDFQGDKTSYDAEWMEISGSALDTALNNLRDLEDKMNLASLQMTMEQTPNSATEAVINEVQNSNKLTGIMTSIESALQQAITIWGEYVGQTTTPQVSITTKVVTQDETLTTEDNSDGI